MTLEQISNLSQTIAAIGVVVTLYYAAQQFRIYIKAAREARLVASSSDIQEFRRMIAADADCARIFRDGLTDQNKLDELEQYRFGAMMQLLVTQVIYLSKFRDVPAEVVPSLIFGRTGAHQWWDEARSGYAEHVVTLIDRLFKACEPEVIRT